MLGIDIYFSKSIFYLQYYLTNGNFKSISGKNYLFSRVKLLKHKTILNLNNNDTTSCLHKQYILASIALL